MRLGIDSSLADRWLRVIEARTESGRTGADWQRRFVSHNGPDFERMTREYVARQAEGTPVHEWKAG